MSHPFDPSLFSNLPRMQRPPRRVSEGRWPLGQRASRQSSPVGNYHPWPLTGGINVVLFAGAGGADQGLEMAGWPVHIAINHDPIAIAAHRALNPHTRHLQADIFEVDPIKATLGKYVNILWLSPDCTHFSTAVGGAPISPRVRSMPWQACRWAGVLTKRGKGIGTIMLENVREIRSWTVLIAKRDKETGRVIKLDGTVAAKGEHVPRHQQHLVPNRKRSGETYRAWVRHMTKLGVKWEDRDLNCADYGVPTSRKRLFGVGVFDRRPIYWPKITHGPRHSQAVIEGTLQPYRTAASFIDWSRPMASIFDRKKPLVYATQHRVAVGMKRFVLDCNDPFLISLPHHEKSAAPDPNDPTAAHSKSAGGEGGQQAKLMSAFIEEHRSHSIGHDVADPLVSQTQKDHHGVVGAYLVEQRGESIGQSAHAPLGSQTQGQHHALMGAWMVQANTGVVGHTPYDPISAMTTTGTQQQVAAAYLIHQRGTGVATSLEEPVRTLATGGNRGGDHIGVAAAFITEYYGNGGQFQACNEPLNTLSTVDRFGVTEAHCELPPLSPLQLSRARQVAAFLRAHGVWSGGDLVTVVIGGSTYVVVDITMRMLHRTEAAAAHELRLPETIFLPQTVKGKTVTEKTGKPVWIERPLTKTQSMRLTGNSVPPRMAMLLAMANCRPALSMQAAE